MGFGYLRGGQDTIRGMGQDTIRGEVDRTGHHQGRVRARVRVRIRESFMKC